MLLIIEIRHVSREGYLINTTQTIQEAIPVYNSKAYSKQIEEKAKHDQRDHEKANKEVEKAKRINLNNLSH